MLVANHFLERLTEEKTGLATKAAAKNKEPKAKIPAGTVFQFKITLLGIEPPVWRRIQTKDCTLDKLHEHIQTAIGWTNSHLHQFKIGGVIYGDPQLLYDSREDDKPPVNSLRTKLSKIVPKDGKQFRFDYEYDFGDGWEHEILFEGFLPAEKGTRYPLCVEGERACPPKIRGGRMATQSTLRPWPTANTNGTRNSWNGEGGSIQRSSTPRPPPKRCERVCRIGGRWSELGLYYKCCDGQSHTLLWHVAEDNTRDAP